MALRLYRTTRRLYRQVEGALAVLHLPALLGSPTAAGLVGLYVMGLILLEAHPTQTRISAVLPARCHDALNRLLRIMRCTWETLGGISDTINRLKRFKEMLR